MAPEMVLFYIFSSLALLCGTMVIRSKNPVHSVLFLILVFCNAAGLLLLVDLDFFAMVFLVVFVGAIAVLFLFVVMMLNIRLAEINENVLRYLPIGGLIGLIFLFEVFLIVDNEFIPALDFNTTAAISTIEASFFYVMFFAKACFALISFQAGPSTLFARFSELRLVLNEEIAVTPLFPVSFVDWSTKVHQSTNIEAIGQVLYTYYFYFFILASLILLVAMIGAIVLTMQKGVHVRKQEIYEQNNREFSQTVLKIRT